MTANKRITWPLVRRKLNLQSVLCWTYRGQWFKSVTNYIFISNIILWFTLGCRGGYISLICSVASWDQRSKLNTAEFHGHERSHQQFETGDLTLMYNLQKNMQNKCPCYEMPPKAHKHYTHSPSITCSSEHMQGSRSWNVTKDLSWLSMLRERHLCCWWFR